jgi:hypothetical protein
MRTNILSEKNNLKKIIMAPCCTTVAWWSAIVSENSKLKVKNTKNSTKNRGNQNLRENFPISPWTNFP